jgi:hypothetical protein
MRNIVKGFITAPLVSLMLLTANVGNAQGANCAARATVIERLTEEYGETRQSIGLARNNSIVEVFASLETGTWTITVTDTSGITCLIAIGQAFENTGVDLTPIKKGDLL